MPFELRKATRHAVPLLLSMSGVSGSGKTLSALLLAAGIAGPKGRVGMIDAENYRGSMYADDPLVMAALPNGYEITDIAAPYSPARYTDAIKALENAGVDVAIVDSTSHEWEGEGGCCDIAETKKLRGMPNWALAKREHKKFLAYCMSSKMSIIFCLRAREKVKMVDAGDVIPGTERAADRAAVIPMGIQPITEKNFVFEQLISLMFDETTHFASPVKVPRMLMHIFGTPHLITKQDGEAIRQWNDSGRPQDDYDVLKKRSATVALEGMKAYQKFFGELTAAQRKVLAATVHEENKRVAEQSDSDTTEMEKEGAPQ